MQGRERGGAMRPSSAGGAERRPRAGRATRRATRRTSTGGMACLPDVGTLSGCSGSKLQIPESINNVVPTLRGYRLRIAPFSAPPPPPPPPPASTAKFFLSTPITMTADCFLHFIGARTGSPAAAPTRVARRGLPQTQHLHFWQGPAGVRCAIVSCSGTSSGGEGGLYKDVSVDKDAGTEIVRRIARMAPSIGGYRGLFPLGDGFLSTDGVGTKLKFAFETGIHDTIGIDLVAMGVNDIVTLGAEPLLFLDSYITSKLDVDLAEKVIKGIVDGCQQSDCLLLGEDECPSGRVTRSTRSRQPLEVVYRLLRHSLEGCSRASERRLHPSIELSHTSHRKIGNKP
ncbi:uncharacterized protein [Miscanthus floridulus]|uniref:uncharacterized protein isoform X2 n=1 Tax=Miscanthus floridulus TaxID=154761 RepID=UPI00345771D8